MANTLFLRLEGPLQSWGERSRWSERDTAPEPTKSGIVGLLGCALGLSEDEDLRTLSRAVRLGVRVDLPGRVLVDYHTIVGGIMSAEGKVKKNASTGEPETAVSRRAYLCDASFLAAVQAEAGWIERLAAAVQAPVWPVYLGRKSCPPACPVFAGVGEFTSLEEALRFAPQQEDATALRARFDPRPRAVMEALANGGARRRDEIDSRSLRTYLPRYTLEIALTRGEGGLV